MSDSFAPRAPRPTGAPTERAQETYRPSPYAAQATPPHGRVAPNGTRAYPSPSLTAKVLVWGGIGVAAAAVTAGGVLAVRKVADLVTGNDELDRDADRAADKARERVYDAARRSPAPASSSSSSSSSSRPARSLAPRFADLSESEREQMRRRQRARDSDTQRHADSVRAHALQSPPRPRRPRKMGLLEEIETTARRLSHSAEGIVGTLGAALAGFRTVAGQAEGVISEFSRTADQIRGLIGTPSTGQPPRDAFRRPRKRDVVDLRDDADAAAARDYGARPDDVAAGDAAGDDHARTHRL